MKTYMRKIWTIAMAAVTMMALSACDNDPNPWDWGRPGWASGNGWNNSQGGHGQQGSSNQLNSYEQALVGSYVSDDDPQSLFYLVLYRDRTGYYKSVKNGNTTGDSFTWQASQSTLRVVYNSSKETSDMTYSRRDNHLYVDGIPLVVNNGQQPTSTAVYVGQWQGVLSGYYKDAWNLDNGSYSTVIEFTSTGAGCQLDYDVTAPTKNFSYNPFTWQQTGNVVNITFASDSQLPDATMTDYAKSGNFLQGKLTYIANIDNQQQRFSYQFSFLGLKDFNWSQYGATTAQSKTRGNGGLGFSMLRGLTDGKVKAAGSFAHGSMLKK